MNPKQWLKNRQQQADYALYMLDLRERRKRNDAAEYAWWEKDKEQKEQLKKENERKAQLKAEEQGSIQTCVVFMCLVLGAVLIAFVTTR